VKVNYCKIFILILILGIGILTSVAAGTGTGDSPKLVTDGPGQITATTAIMRGHLENPNPGQMYEVKFRYEFRDDKTHTKHSTAIVVLPNLGSYTYSYLLSDLNPGVTIDYRAVAASSVSTQDPNPLDAGKSEPLTTTSNTYKGIDTAIFTELDTLIPSDLSVSSEYFDIKWGITPDQYKLMLATLIWGEGGKYGFAAHSGAPTDTIDYPSDTPVFRYSTGIGPIQIDRGGYSGKDHTLDWSHWSTYEKLNYQLTLRSALRYIKKTSDNNDVEIKNLEDMRNLINGLTVGYGGWYAAYLSTEGKGKWEVEWNIVTGTTWDNVNQLNSGTTADNSKLLPGWNVVKTKFTDKWTPLSMVVRDLGTKHWKIDKTVDGKNIVIKNHEITPGNQKDWIVNYDQDLQTYSIQADGIGWEESYIYGLDEVNHIEIWAYSNPYSENNLKYIFVRDYNKNEFPEGKNGYTLNSPAIGSNNLDLALVIDGTNSMVTSDPTKLRIAAAKLFVEKSDMNDQFAIVEFDSTSTLEKGLTSIKTDKVGILNAIDKIGIDSGTNITSGLLMGYNQLNSQNANSLNKKAIILITDGGHNTGPSPLTILPLFVEKQWPIYTIGLIGDTNQLDEELMRQLSDSTGGLYEQASNSDKLQSIYAEFFATIKGLADIHNENGQISQGETKKSSFKLNEGIKSIDFTGSWGGSQIDFRLIDPNGNPILIDKNSPTGTTNSDITFTAGATYQIYKILNPMSGIWNYTVTGVQTNGVENYNVLVAADTNQKLSIISEQSTYSANEPVLIKASFTDDLTPISSAHVTYQIFSPNVGNSDIEDLVESEPGIYTGSYIGSYLTGHYSILIVAEKGDIIRETTGSFDVIPGNTTVVKPFAGFTFSPNHGNSPLEVSFNDTSTGTPPLSYQWNFGDGSKNETIPNPIHIFITTMNQTFKTVLTVTNSAGSNSKSYSIAVNITPPKPTFLADFTVSPISGIAPLTVTCIDKSVGKPSMLVYDFGDGVNMTGPNPVHTYRFPGMYTITLSIIKYNATSNSVMNNVVSKTNVITVTRVPSVPLIAKFTASPINGTAPLTVFFIDQSSGDPTFLNYDFGDGTNATGQNPVHTYVSPGIYNVTMSIMKNDVKTGSVINNVSVQKNLIIVN